MKNKIFHITYGLDIGGIESQFLFLANNNKYFNFDHHFIAISKKGLVFNQILKFHKKKIFYFDTEIKKQNFFLIIFKYLFLIKKNKPYKVHFYGNDICLYLGIASSFFRINYICEIIGETNFKPFTKFILKNVYSNADKIICVSKNTKIFFNKHFKVDKKNIITRNPPIRILTTNRNNNNKLKLSFIYIGRFEKVKNLFNLINAFKKFQLIFNKSSLVLIGDGSLKNDLLKIVGKKNHLNISVVNKTLNFEKYLFNTNYIIQPSFSEGFGLSICEVMKLGIIPVINRHLPLFNNSYSIAINGHSEEKIYKSLKLITQFNAIKINKYRNNSIKFAKKNIEKINKLNNFEYYY